MLTRERYRKIIDRKKEQSQTNRQLVFEAMKWLGRPATSTEIFNYIHNRLLRKFEKEFEDLRVSGKIPASNNESYRNKLWKQKGINLRTVQRQLDSLSRDGFLIHNKKYYSLSSMDYPEAKIWAKEFGSAALSFVMRLLYPEYNRFEYNMKILVQIFGAFLIYCFIEAARPISDNKKNPIPGNRRDELALSWIDSMVDPRRLFYYFVAFTKSQPEEEQVRKIRRRMFGVKNGKFLFRGSLNDLEYNLNLIMPAEVKSPLERTKKQENFRERKSILEADVHVTENMRRLLRKNYPILTSQMDAIHNQFNIKNKEGFNLRTRKRNFTAEESIHGFWNDILEKIPEWDDELRQIKFKV